MKKLAPHRLPITLIKKMIDKKKKGKKKNRGGGGQQEPEVEVAPEELQPPVTTPFITTPGSMSPGTYPMSPPYPYPMQPQFDYPMQPQFPQAYPSGGGGGGYQPNYEPQQPYYEPPQQEMPQFINTEEESEWQPPTPMYSGPSAYEADPGQRGMQVQQSQASPFDTGENEYASGDDPGDGFPGEYGMSGWLTTGGESWEDAGVDGEYDVQIQGLLMQAQILRGQGQESAARGLEAQAKSLQSMQDGEEGDTNWLLLGGIALGAWLLFGKRR
jgi:hypothetical protein